MISIVLPVYNEAKTISSNILKLRSFMDQLGVDYEIIVCEDSSTDDTLEVIQGIASDRLRILHSEKRLGRGRSLSNAMTLAKGETIVYMDADLATNLNYIKPLIAGVEAEADIVTGSRLLPGSIVRSRSLSREFLSRGYNIILRLMFRTLIRDHQCGFKAFRKSSVLPLLDIVGDSHWFWDTELLIRAQNKGLRVSEIPVEWTDRSCSSVLLKSDIPYMGISALMLRLRI